MADHDERAIHTVDVESMRQIAVTPLGGRPGHVRVLADGRIAVALRDTGDVLLLEAADDAMQKPLEERCKVRVSAVEPWALAETGDKLLVSSGFGAALTVLNSGDLGVVRVVALSREPRAVMVVNQGKTAFVTHAVGGIVSAVDLENASSRAETASLQAGRRVMPNLNGFDDKNPRKATQGYALARVDGLRKDGLRDALRIFVPHTSVDPGAEASVTTGGYGGTGTGPRAVAQIVSVVDPIAKKSITNHVDGMFHGPSAQDCMLPRSAAADDKSLFVACMDIDAVVEYDPWVGDPTVAEKHRFVVPGGPGGLVMDENGKTVVVWSEFDRAVSRIDREAKKVESLVLWQRAGEKRDAKVDRGRRLFHTSRDARLAQARACANCHPDGRDDGLVWTSPDGKRQTMMLAGRIEGTAPYGWFGEHKDVRQHVKDTLQRLGGTGLSDPPSAADFDALLAFVASIPAPPMAKAADEELVKRGKEVYASYSCDTCHKGGGTDRIAHDVGSGVKGERSTFFDTPSLVGIRGSAPYFHDGRYETLEALLSEKNQRMFSGVISPADKTALIAYLETL
ncbi:MAG: c-type cytochrome [Polyangiaceae bacterium]|nr:c-type cytochrome [Polyangiaceae bacterium]